MKFYKLLAKTANCFLVLALVSCSKTGEPVKSKSGEPVFINDFEAVQFWGGTENTSIVKGDAHSGEYATLVDAQNEYGYTFKGKLNKLVTAKPKRAEITAWAKLNAATPAVIVFSVNKPENTEGENYWNALNLSDQVKDYGKWVRVKKEFTLPANLNMDSELSCFLWRATVGEPALIDDLQIRLITE